MKLSLFVLLLAFTIVRSIAQPVMLQPTTNQRKIKLYRATVRTMSDEKISGIFYAMTDSTLVFFANNKATIQQFKAGHQPELFTVDATNVKRLTIRQKKQFLRSLILGISTGVVVGSVGVLTGGPARTTTISAVSYGVGQILANYLFVKEIERYRGDTNRFRRARNRIGAYTIDSQLQLLPARTGTGR